jgi:hypothetical protein
MISKLDCRFAFVFARIPPPPLLPKKEKILDPNIYSIYTSYILHDIYSIYTPYILHIYSIYTPYIHLLFNTSIHCPNMVK